MSETITEIKDTRYSDLVGVSCGTICLADELKVYADLRFVEVPKHRDRIHRWIMGAPAIATGTPTKAHVFNAAGELRYTQDIGDDVRLTQECAVEGEWINVAKWRLRINGEVLLRGRGVKWDGYGMEG